jgi:hypothetical protein
MKDKVRLGQARLGYVRFLDKFESPGLPGSLKKIIRVIEYFKIEYFGITSHNYDYMYLVSTKEQVLRSTGHSSTIQN